MNKLQKTIEIEKNGRYKYIGFLLKSETIFGGTGEFEYSINGEKTELKEAKKLGEQYLFFKDEKNDFFFVMNTNLKDANLSLPFGTFQKNMSSFNSTFDVKVESIENVKTFDIFTNAINI